METKSNTGLVVVVTLLVVAVAGLIGFIVYDKVLKEETPVNSGNNNNIIDNVEEVKEISLTNSLITSLKYPMDNFIIGYKSHWDYKNINISDLSRADMMHTAAYELEPIREDKDYNSIYSANEVETNFKNIFGPDTSYYNGDIKDPDYNCGYITDYNKSDNTYIGYSGCGGDSLGYIDRLSKSYKATQQGDYIYVYSYVQSIAVEPSQDMSSALVYLLDHNDKKLTTIDYENYEQNVYGMMIEGKVDTYKWTFKKQSDGQYYFYMGNWEEN